MRILLVSSLKQTATANYIVNALRRDSHEVLIISDVESCHGGIVTGGAPDVFVLASQNQFDPELVLFIEGGSHRLFPLGLERFSCPTAWYAIDTHMDYDKHVALAKCFDLTFIAQKRFATNLARDAGVKVVWLPLAFPSEFAREWTREKTIDLAFVGSKDPRVYPGRARALDLLSQYAATIEIDAASPAEMMKRYGRAKVVFNQCANADLNMRFFEAMGSGAVLLTDAAPGLHVEELFQPGVHFLAYADEDDMLVKFQTLMQDQAQVEAIGSAAREQVIGYHTYDHRVRAIVDCASSTAKRRRPSSTDMLAAYAALNMPAESMRCVIRIFDEMGQGSRIGRVARVVGWLLRPMDAALRLVFVFHRLTTTR